MDQQKTVQLQEKLMVLDSMVSRMALSGRLGTTHGGKRDLYEECGYTRTPTFTDYLNVYTRGGIGRRIITAMPDATWARPPDVYETEEDKETPFEKKWKQIIADARVFHYLHRLDRLSGIGSFGIAVLGFDDGRNFDTECKGANNLLYLQPYREDHVTVSSWETDPKNVRYGLPVSYKVCPVSPKDSNEKNVSSSLDNKLLTSFEVHWTRVLHVAEGCDENDVYGTPRVKPVLNYLYDLDKVCGGSSEMFWRAGYPGIAFEMDKDAVMSTEEIDGLQEEVDKYIHNLSRYLRLKGMKANQLKSDNVDPDSQVKNTLQLISGATGIPVRILTGSERGELASTQDETSWSSRILERRSMFASPCILMPFVEALQRVNVLPDIEPIVEWRDPTITTETQRADIGKKRTESLAAYANSRAPLMIGPQQFLTNVMGMTTEAATAVLADAKGLDDLLKLALTETQTPPNTGGIETSQQPKG